MCDAGCPLQRGPRRRDKTLGKSSRIYATVNLRTNWPLFSHCDGLVGWSCSGCTSATPVTMQIANVLDRLAVTLLSHSCHNDAPVDRLTFPAMTFEVRLNAS